VTATQRDNNSDGSNATTAVMEQRQ